MHYKCDCCNRSLNGHPTHGYVLASSCGPVSYRYCDECMNGGIEPYNALVAYIALASTKISDLNKNYQMTIMKNLIFYNKSIKEFEDDMKKANKAFVDNCPSKEKWAEIDAAIEEAEREMKEAEEEMMNIDSPEGTKIRFTGKGGYDSANKLANKQLKVGEVYTVDHTIIKGWCTDVYIKELPGMDFDSTMFTTIKEDN